MSADYAYGAFGGGPDPLADPFDAAAALDELGAAVLDGANARQALRDLLRRGTQGRRGLAELARMVRDRQAQARRAGRLDGTLDEVRRLLDTAVGQERAALFADPSDDARLEEAQLDALPSDPARAVRSLADRSWRSPEAAATYQQIRDLLTREVLDSQFAGIKQALDSQTPADRQALKDMLGDLNGLLAAHNRGEDTTAALEQFLDRHGQFFPDRPGSVDELVDQLARRAAAGQRLLDALSEEQRADLANLISATLDDLGLAAEMSALGSQLRQARPDLDWGGRPRRSPLRGTQGLGLSDATGALAELADLDELASALEQDYPGASMDDVDPALVARALGRDAVDDVRALAQLERQLVDQGYLTRDGGRLELTPRAVRRLGQSALASVFARLAAPGRGEHDLRDAGASGESTGASRAWQFGDEQPLDVVGTVRNAVLRTAAGGGRGAGRDAGRGAGSAAVRLQADDFVVQETERRASAAVALLVDLSYSMALRGTWAAAKQTALALHTLVTTRYPADRIAVIGFSDYAVPLTPTQLAGLDAQMVKGTNLQHALMLAGRHLARFPDAEPVVLVVTDGEPTAHLERDGSAYFSWPPEPETLALTMAEVDKLTRRGAAINVFMLDDEPALVDFVSALARRNGGRVFQSEPGDLGAYVVRDYLRARRGR